MISKAVGFVGSEKPIDEVEFERQQAQAAAKGKKAPKNLSVRTSVDNSQQQYEQNLSQAAARDTDGNAHKEELKAREEAWKSKKAAAEEYIKQYITSSSCQNALKTYQEVYHQVYASSKQGFWSASVNALKNLGAAFTGSPDIQAVNEGDVIAKMGKDPGKAVEISRAGNTLSDLLEYAKKFNITWKDITNMVYETSNGKMDIRDSKEGLISSMKKGSSTDLNKKEMERTLFRNKGGELQYSSMNPEMAASSVDMKTLANDIVKYNNKAKELTVMLKSLEQSTNVSAANLLQGVKTPGGLYVNNQGNRVNFNENQNKHINQLLGDIQTLKTEQDAIANIVDNIPDGSSTDYEFVKAYRAAVENDQLVNKGAIIPKLDEILMHHPSQQAGGDLYAKAKANVGV